ncbi:MAG: DUF1080 domain-containing protein [Bryobacteraceae bacterium]|jgi:hypothetical protein
MTRQTFLKLAVAGIPVAAARAQQAAPKPNPDLGFTDTPMLPGLPWHVHDPARPHPQQIRPSGTPGGPPSDAVVLFDGSDLSRWNQRGRGADAGKFVDARWKVGGGWFEVAPNTGDLLSREKFGDCQIHVEWSSPTEIHANSQGRGNSGVLIMSRYEMQVLDAWDNPTYADGQAGAIYGQWPPLVNPARRPGEWNTYDIAFEAPRFDGEKLVRPAFVTLFYNGVIVHNRKEILGAMVYRKVATYTAHGAEEPLMLQDHHNPVRYRNIWVRRVNGYDRPEA